MSEKNSATSTNCGIGVCGLLGVVFIVLKLVGTISWSWVWVLSPIWIPMAMVFAILLIVVVAAIVMVAVENKR